MTEYAHEFGKHVRGLRRARGMTQDALAARSGLSADTIRGVEHGSFSASIDTLRKVCVGLGVSPATVFESFELGRNDERRELVDLIASRGPKELELILRIVRALLDELDRLRDDVARRSRLPGFEDLPLLLQAEEVAALLRVSRKALYAMVERGEIPGVTKLGRRVRFRRDALEAWLIASAR